MVDILIQSWITQLEDKLSLDVYPDLSQMYIHTQLDEAIFFLYTLDEITYLIFRVTLLKVIFIGIFWLNYVILSMFFQPTL